jgi:carbon-monoxide dehydrogenase large subunit
MGVACSYAMAGNPIDHQVAQRWVGSPLPRREDPALLTGWARYLADLHRPGVCHVGFVRSTEAHADITAVRTEAALAVPGIVAVLTADDFGRELPPQPSTHALGNRPTPYYALARDRVRHVGEAVVAVVAETAAALADAIGLVEIDYSARPVVADTMRALEPDSPVIFDGWPDNVAGTFDTAMGDVDAAIAGADVVVRARVCVQRQTGGSMEGRGALAEWDPYRRELVLWTSTQSPHIVRDFIAEVTGVPTPRVKVKVPQVGGGFGAKFHFYAEESTVALIAIRLGRPVMWSEGRSESFVATVHARESVVDAVIAARRDGTVVGITGDIVADQGAYMHMVSFGPAWLTAVMMTNTYLIPNARATMRAVVTNKTPTGSYRGWGQPEANFVVERMMDLLSNELSMDPAELRRRNLVPPERMPYTSLFHTFDSGYYEVALDRGLELAGYATWRAEQAKRRAAGGHVQLGIGLSFWVENTALGPSRQMNMGGLNQGGFDISKIRLEPNGEVTLYTGLCEMGQGFTNGLAAMCADTLGVRVDAVTVVTGDTDACPYTGHGTGASRSASVGGGAVRKASLVLQDRIRPIAAHMLECAEADLVFENGTISVVGTPARSVTMADIGRAAYLRAIELPPGLDPGLEVTETFDPENCAWPYGLGVAVVEVDTETGLVKVVDYSVFHDCGTVLNPMIVEGQLHGGSAQGIAAALMEEIRYDEDGQPLNSNFMTFLMPSAVEMPNFRLAHMTTESPVIPGGMKGIGEAGIIGAPAAVVSAVDDALRPFGIPPFLATPITPLQIFEAIHS